MTRKQEIEEMARTTASHITSDKDMQVAFADVLRRGAEWADSTMIDKACEWLEENFRVSSFDNTKIITHFSSMSDVLDSFRKTMKRK